jgi:hypothetical protein
MKLKFVWVDELARDSYSLTMSDGNGKDYTVEKLDYESLIKIYNAIKEALTKP